MFKKKFISYVVDLKTKYKACIILLFQTGNRILVVLYEIVTENAKRIDSAYIGIFLLFVLGAACCMHWYSSLYLDVIVYNRVSNRIYFLSRHQISNPYLHWQERHGSIHGQKLKKKNKICKSSFPLTSLL